MQAILIAGLLMTFDADATIRTLWDAEFACVEGQNHDGELISEEIRAEACSDIPKLEQRLKDNGYCFDADEWSVCA